MIWLIDQGDSYHQHVTLVVEGDDSPADVIAAYGKQLDDHLKEARQLTAKAGAIIGKKPKLSDRSCTNKFRQWQGRLRIYLDKNQKIPAPVLKDFLADAGFRLMDHATVKVS